MKQRPPRPAKPRDYSLHSPSRGIVVPEETLSAARAMAARLDGRPDAVSTPRVLFQGLQEGRPDVSSTPRVLFRSPPVSTPGRTNVRKAPMPVQDALAPESNSRATKRARIMTDELGEFIRMHSRRFEEMEWSQLTQSIRQRGDLGVQDTSLHPGLGLLKSIQRSGVPVIMSTPPWSTKRRTKHVRRGPHKSCLGHLDFIRTEMLDFVRKGYWMVLPYRLVKDLPDLRLSPLGVVPQRERRPRLIVDYTFNGVNEDTVKMMPNEAMQFGRALERVLYSIHHANPHFGPVYISKTDLADGFYRIPLSASGTPKLGVILPTFPNEEQMVAFPLVLPMGWVESPPAFCAATETVADLANNLPLSSQLPQHPLERVASTQPEVAPVVKSQCDSNQSRSATKARPRLSHVLRPFRKPVALHDIYVDDFISLIQGSTRRRRWHIRRLLHSIDRVFRPLDAHDSSHRQHVASVKKFLKGDGSMQVEKSVLGWLINTAQGTLELPPHRRQRLAAIFEEVKGKTRLALAKWHKILGELRSMAIGVPGSKGLFSTLQVALQFTEEHRVRITPAMHDQLADFELLAQDLSQRPTAIAELVPDHPVAIGPHDASGQGMGGAWLPATTNSNLPPLMWRAEFPPAIQADLVSDSNPLGSINNSQLELAGNIAHQDVLVQHVNCARRTIVPLGDNISQVAWQHKGSVTTLGPTAYLLRLNSLHQRHFRYLAKPDYIPGPMNVMADDLSRLWHLSDSQLLSYFNLHYPQDQSWTLVHLRPEMLSSLTSALQKRRVNPALLLNAPPRKMVIGESGKSIAAPLGLAPTSKRLPSSYLFSKFLQSVSAPASSPPPVNLSQLGEWRTTYAPSVRRSPVWGPRTLV